MRFVLDLVEPALDHIADADDADEPAVLDHREVADAAVGHLGHQLGDAVARIAGHHRPAHHLADANRQQVAAVAAERLDDVTLGYDADDVLAVIADDERADAAQAQHRDRTFD